MQKSRNKVIRHSELVPPMVIPHKTSDAKSRNFMKDLVPTLDLIKTAVLNGELDTQIEAAAKKL